jgi:hypothetical protein
VADRRPSPTLLAVLLASGCLALYLKLLSARYNFDGTVFALWLSDALHTGSFENLLHPHHILHGPLMFALASALRAGGVDLLTVTLLQLADVLLAGLALVIFHQLCSRLTEDLPVTIAATLGLAFSFGFWYAAVEAEVHMLYTCVTLAGFAVLWSWTRADEPGPGPLRSAALGALGFLIVGAHLAGGLLLIPFAWALARLRPRAWQSGGMGGPLPAFSLGACLPLACVYAAGYQVSTRAHGKSFAVWVLDLANPDTGLGYSQSYWRLTAGALPEWVVGFARAFVAGAPHRLDDSPVLFTARVAALAGVSGAVLLYAAALPRLEPWDRRVHALLLLSLAPLSLFTIVWEPSNFEQRIVLLPLLWLAAAYGCAFWRRRAQTPFRRRALGGALLAAVAVLFAHNLSASFLPGADAARNHDLERAWFIRDHTEPAAAVYIAGTRGGYNAGKIYIPYFALRRVRAIDLLLGSGAASPLEALAPALEADRGRPIYLLSELVEPSAALELLSAHHHMGAEEIRAAIARLGPREAARLDAGFALYRVTRPLGSGTAAP